MIYSEYNYRFRGNEWYPFHTEQCREAIMNLCK